MEDKHIDASRVREKIEEAVKEITPKKEAIFYNPNYRHNIKMIWESPKWRRANKASCAASIVETRPQETHKLKLTISSLSKKLKVPIHIFCGTENINDVLKIAASTRESPCKLFQIESGIKSTKEYNQLLMSYEYWENIQKCEKILIFQTDSSVCNKSAHKLEDFSVFDYIGGQWGNKRPSGFLTYGGCGGFSLRDYRMSILALKMFGNSGWQFGEDGFFAFFIEVLHGRVANQQEMDKFCSQLWWKEGCFGIHKLDLAKLSNTELKSVKIHCPNWISMTDLD
ncbi:DUF5672 family protein [Synechococcus sp. GEYO]|uniref:DUF5672 family protein n=1 Tax=Synechococcus sp. GEYO TaxID=2575511 RepID=UPI000E0EE90D|nr:DUF5672 family protein [Synechococcus sp. GEYO]